MQGAPGLDVGDDSFDLIAELVDGLVVGLLGQLCAITRSRG